MRKIQLKNFIVYVVLGLSLLLLHACIQRAILSFAHKPNIVVFVLKACDKLLPLIAVIGAELILCAKGAYSLLRLVSLKKTVLVDVYCYILTHVHAVTAVLSMLFTLSIPFFIDKYIVDFFPEQLKIFPYIASHTHVSVAIVLFVLLTSFFSYWEHRIWHTRIFWPIHRFHHAATEFTVLTNFRIHFTESLLSPLFNTLPLAVLGAPLEFIFTYVVLIQYQGFMSHIDQEISYGWIGKYLWTDPVYHKVHHSIAIEHINKNFSGTLPIWDLIFGTYASSSGEVKVGVSDGEVYNQLPYWRMYVHDFMEFAHNIKTSVRNIALPWRSAT